MWHNFSTQPRLGDFILIALNTGMRMGEILGLRWTDLTADFILIRDSKSGRSRKVPINACTREALERLREASKGSEFVFPGLDRQGHLKTPRTAFKAACRRAGISGLRIHDLRHQAASSMVLAGVDLHTVSKILGHSTVKLTERYSHPGLDHTLEAVKRLEGIFDPKSHSSAADGTDVAQSITKVAVNSRDDRR